MPTIVNMNIVFSYYKTKDGKCFIGMIPTMPGVVSQASTLEELKENLKDAARMLITLYSKEASSLMPAGVTSGTFKIVSGVI